MLPSSDVPAPSHPHLSPRSLQVKSLFADKPLVVRASNLSLLAVPFRPFLVSTAHTLVMQGEFARQAMKHEVRAARKGEESEEGWREGRPGGDRLRQLG